MKKLFRRAGAVAALGAAAALMLSGCGAAADSDSGATSDSSKGAVAMGFAGMDITIWNDQLKFMEPIIEDAGYEFLTSDPQWDVQKQVSDWEAWIQRGDVKAIMGFPVQSDAMVPVTAKATQADIPVLGYATRWEGTVAGTIIDSYEDGYLVGAAAAEWITENKADEDEVPVAVVADKTSDLGKGRTEGIIDAITENAPNAKIYELPGISREEGNSVAKSHLVAVPDTQVWVGTSNDNTAGAYQSLLDSGVAKDDPDYYVGATDATNETLDVIKIPGSIWRGGFILPAQQLAESNADLLLRAAAGEDVEDNVITSTRVTAENADEFYIN
ncbi:sugar ABC transporter substrate-binding protein [Leucobacter luti]|uniref:ABC-type sugar transport system substrate-binding protein n=1 Tax=Leucobacter luti TaxID=340320 RepID=A0A4V6MD37_9MICO|nr:substrate-binding domain-containing protein [Leucobacter luti]MBL3699211.1 sugar ABC transporter substrate-binding protein [Leucobacter luti]RZT66709.1 ABC-type sugar transport system substrate-binding protein [Leucobacter luti]